MDVLSDEFADRRRRVLRQISASQVDLYQTCARKWYYSYIEGRREPQSPAQAAGQAIDDEYVQPYLQTGARKADGPWSEHLAVLIPYLPKPGENLLVQHRFEIPTYVGGPIWLGFMDWVRQRGPDWLQAEDLKSTSDFRYAKTAEQLLRNTQMMSYAEALHHDFAPDAVSIGHVVIRRKNPKVLVTPGPSDPPLYVSRQHAADFYGAAVEDVRKMVEAARSCATADDLTPNTEACSDYGGCFHRARCAGLISTHHLTKGFPKMSTPNGTGLTLAERLAKRNAETAAAAAAAPPTSPFTLQAPFRSAPAPVTAKPDAVVPPDAPPRESTPEYVAEVEAAAKKPRKTKAVKETADLETKLDAALSAAEEDEEAQLEAKLKATREKKAAAAAEAARAADLAKKAAEEAELERAREEVRQASVTAKAKIAEASKALKTELDAQIPARAARKVPATKPILLIDCLPQKGAVAVPLEEWLAPIAEAAAAAYTDPKTGAQGVADWRLISYNSAPVLAVAIRAALDTCPEVLTIDSRQRGAEIVLEELIPHAALVIRGVR